jgi:hypothetical protein
LEIEVLNVDDPNNEYLLGKATGNLRQLLPRFNEATTIKLPLMQDAGTMHGELSLIGFITEMETVLGSLMIFLVEFYLIFLSIILQKIFYFKICRCIKRKIFRRRKFTSHV